jgi:excisionase family DNA binding protein
MRIAAMDAALPKMLTTEDVRVALNVSINKLYALIAAGELPATKVGRDYRFWPRDIELLLDRNRVDVAS